MKAVQVTLDEALLKALDREPAVRARGRSAVLREAAQAWLQLQKDERIAQAYARAYKDKPVDAELEWPAEAQAWPDP